jgi:hypothetical protein
VSRPQHGNGVPLGDPFSGRVGSCQLVACADVLTFRVRLSQYAVGLPTHYFWRDPGRHQRVVSRLPFNPRAACPPASVTLAGIAGPAASKALGSLAAREGETIEAPRLSRSSAAFLVGVGVGSVAPLPSDGQRRRVRRSARRGDQVAPANRTISRNGRGWFRTSGLSRVKRGPEGLIMRFRACESQG